MPTRAQVLALLDEGQSFEAAGRVLGIAPGQAYMIATGLPADGSDTPHPDELRGADKLGRGASAKSKGSDRLEARTHTADRVVKSVCPYCAVGCAQNVFVKDDRVIQIEGDPDAPHSRGRLCPKGSASLQLTTGASREEQVLYRPPHAADWQRLDLKTATEMVADRIVATRREGWQRESEDKRVRRCMSMASARDPKYTVEPQRARLRAR